MELATTHFLLSEVLNFQASMMGVNAGEKGLTLSIGVEPEVPAVLFGDKLRLQQILTNLLGNAIKFTEQGEVSLSVDCPPVPLSDAVLGPGQPMVLRFCIRDTGIGMSQAQQERIFEMFSQADVSTTRHFGGSGLGLIICKRLVEMMGGQIDLVSEIGRGTEFYVILPFQAEPSVGVADDDRARAAASSPQPTADRVFDADQMMALCKNSEDSRAALVGMIRNVINESLPKFQCVRQAWQVGQHQDAARILHTMRGSIGSLGAQAFADAAMKLERAINAQADMDQAQQPIEALFEVTQRALDELVQQAEVWLLAQSA